MLVVMLISSLSITITYTCYTIFSNHYLSYKKRSDELANYILLDKLLAKDVSSSSRVEKTGLGMNCISKKENIGYEFYDQYVLRRSTIVDTFYIKAVQIPVFKMMGKTENIPGALVEEISLETVYKEEKLYFYYKKEYGADVLIQFDDSAI